MALEGLKELYADEIPKRGDILVSFKENLEDGVAGVIANVFTQITGATTVSGFKGIGGKFVRHSLMKFNDDIPSNVKLTRWDTGKSVEVFYNHNVIAGNPLQQQLMQKIMQNIATDDERIFEAVEKFGGKALFTSKDHTCGTERVAEASNILGLSKEDLIINLQGDQPLFPPDYFHILIKPFFNSSLINMATLATPIKDLKELENPNKVKVVLDKEGNALYFSRSPIPYFRKPGKEPLYLKHVGVYAYKKEFLDKFVKLPEGELEKAEKLEQLRALEHGFKIAVSIVPSDIPEVDTPEDLEYIINNFKRS